MNFFKGKSLQFKILLLTCGIVFAIGLGVVYEIEQFVGNQRHVQGDDLKSVATSASDAIQAQFFERYGDVQAFATNPMVRSSSKQEIVKALDAYAGLYLIYDLIIVADLNGQIVGVNSKDPITGKAIPVEKLYGRSVAKEAWFKNTVLGKTTDDKDKGFVGTFVESVHIDPFVSEIYGEKRIGTSFSSIINDEQGNPIGVISNRAGSRWFEGELENALSAVADKGYKSTDFRVFNNEGLLLSEAKMKDGKVSISKKFNELLVLNLKEKNFSPVKKLFETKEDGYVRSQSFDGSYEIISGYTAMTGKKWIDSIGWNIVVTEPTAEAFAALDSIRASIYIVLGVIFLVSIFAGVFFARSLSANLKTVATKIVSNAKEVSSISESLAQGSASLSSSTSEQAAALQETVASIDQVSAMVGKNADNARRSQEISNQSSDSAEKGKTAVSEVIRSMSDISDANHKIGTEIEESNKKISEIVNLIQEIGSKTKVINDIVFQTKLLSFNASVEAARAGEHGKGFAVVAEEVGNLAQMSGNAAKEISDMLDGSISKVENIVEESKQKIAKLMESGKEKVEEGTDRANRCGEVLDEIVQSVKQVNAMVSEIATASGEQSQGVDEINRAMNQLDQVTQANAVASQDASNNADRLREQGEHMTRAIETLVLEIDGGKAKTHMDQFMNESISSKISKSDSGSNKGAKIVEFPKVKEKSVFKKDVVTKKASGSEYVPDRDDDRFEEV